MIINETPLCLRDLCVLALIAWYCFLFQHGDKLNGLWSIQPIDRLRVLANSLKHQIIIKYVCPPGKRQISHDWIDPEAAIGFHLMLYLKCKSAESYHGVSGGDVAGFGLSNETKTKPMMPSGFLLWLRKEVDEGSMEFPFPSPCPVPKWIEPRKGRRQKAKWESE
jgi:hypothetical protein